MFKLMLGTQFYKLCFSSSVSDFALTSLHRAPALLDTYTLGLLARFLPTDPAIRGQKSILHASTHMHTKAHIHTHYRGFPWILQTWCGHCFCFHIWKICNPRTQTIAFCIFSWMWPLFALPSDNKLLFNTHTMSHKETCWNQTHWKQKWTLPYPLVFPQY